MCELNQTFPLDSLSGTMRMRLNSIRVSSQCHAARKNFLAFASSSDNFGEAPGRSSLPSFDKSPAKPRPRKAVSSKSRA